jgi:hypothetical protein
MQLATWLQARRARYHSCGLCSKVRFARFHSCIALLLCSATQRNWTASREANALPHDLGSQNRRNVVSYRCSPEFAETASRAFGTHFHPSSHWSWRWQRRRRRRRPSTLEESLHVALLFSAPSFAPASSSPAKILGLSSMCLLVPQATRSDQLFDGKRGSCIRT